MFLRKKIVKGVAAGVGLASESITAYKTNRRSQNASPTEEHSSESSTTTPSIPQHEHQHEQIMEEQHEAEWELDEVQDQLHHDSPPEYTPTQDVDQLARAFLESHPAAYSVPAGHPQLSYPVILPQRRPRSRKRGFIRAYAPVLDEFGIEQAMFIDFLETSNKACQAAGWIAAINLASIGTMFMPSAIGIAVSIMIQVGTDVAIAAENRRKTNTYFDKINQEMFHPRGLHCLVMTWKPESDSPCVSFDLNSAISNSVDHGGSGWMNKMKHKYKSSDGKTYGNLPFPETAPLVFPDLDELAVQSPDAEKKLKEANSRRAFVAHYLDRRGQAEFVRFSILNSVCFVAMGQLMVNQIMENPTSDLNKAPKPEFTSRYADPSHPASSGSLMGLVTGGHITGDQIRPMRGRGGGLGGSFLGRGPIGQVISGVQASRSRSTGGSDQPQSQHREYGQSPGGFGLGSRNPREGLLGGGMKKMLKSNVMYLMIVNLPSEEEMRHAREMLHC
ncbi:uncharacterized protein LDX57_008631 [Aspergillus melleus]|uniref:uncharacterized protein n=1 Tax=Aspergillus melleus TaxID=138277 RepID=UPI001E8E8234|nr:uncharacterized protein LDX57_008631 [Aspergillus melleus]KAH8430969.1 hypothetical protein LDX57_008631 [Aspergillus melleus]